MARITVLETRLREAFSDVPTANVTLALYLMQGRYSDAQLDAIPAVAELRHRCYSEPWHHHKLMTALDSLLGTHGCESLGPVDQHGGPPVEYLNTGDSYAWTVVWFRHTARFEIMGWADAAERLERRGVAL